VTLTVTASPYIVFSTRCFGKPSDILTKQSSKSRKLSRLLLKYCVPYRNRTRSGGQSIAGHESDVFRSNSYKLAKRGIQHSTNTGKSQILTVFSRNLCRMGLRIDVSVLSWIRLPMFSESLHRLTSRFFLDLRAIASHQPRTRFENPGYTPPQSPLFALATNQVYPRQTFCRNRETDIDKSIYTNETNPTEGGIQQAEIFDLEVLTSRHTLNTTGTGTIQPARMSLTKSCYSPNTCLCNYTHSGLQQNNRFSIPMLSILLYFLLSGCVRVNHILPRIGKAYSHPSRASDIPVIDSS